VAPRDTNPPLSACPAKEKSAADEYTAKYGTRFGSGGNPKTTH
jgi:hypothetical protein